MTSRSKTILAAGLMATTALLGGAAAAQDHPPLATLPPPPIPVDNPMSDAIVELGRQLFWDGRLSGNGTMGCVACHQPELGWGTGGSISLGYPGTQHWRHSQTILNSAYHNKLFWEGNVTSLEAQAQAAAGGAVAGNGDDSMMEMNLRFVPEYVEAFRAIWGTDWPHIAQAWMAIAAFQRTIVTDPEKVPFDRWLAGDTDAMSESALRGMEIFSDQGGCIACHNGALVSDQRYYNIGVPAAAEFALDPIYQITLRWELYQKGMPEQDYRAGDDDLGLYHVTKRPADKGKFRTPSLRELRWTGPYMHNGAFWSLEEVVDFKNAGGGEGQTAGLAPLGLSEDEKADLVAFIEALSMDEPFLMEPPELPATATWAEFPR